jgi:hypothetical protein
MRRSVVSIACVVGAATTVLSAGTLLQQQRSSSERHIYVRVTDSKNLPVDGLTPKDIIVREDDLAREVLRVEPAPPPTHIALLVDNTPEAQPILVDLRASLVRFAQAMSAQPMPPMLSLASMAERPTRHVDFTTSDIAIENGVKQIFPRPSSGSTLLEGIVEACAAFRRAKAERPAILAFVIEASSEFSDRMHTNVADALRSANASLWTIELQQARSSTDRNALERARVVNEVTAWSGGMNRTVLSEQAIARAFEDMSSAMLSRYDVTYGRPQSLIPPSRIAVETRDKNLRVVTSRWAGE